MSDYQLTSERIVEVLRHTLAHNKHDEATAAAIHFYLDHADEIGSKSLDDLTDIIDTIRSSQDAAIAKLVADLSTEVVAPRKGPPGFAQWLILLLIKGRRADAILGDLDEIFARDCEQHGVKRARWLYRARVLHSIAPLLWVAIKRFGVVAAVADLVRRHLGG